MSIITRGRLITSQRADDARIRYYFGGKHFATQRSRMRAEYHAAFRLFRPSSVARDFTPIIRSIFPGAEARAMNATLRHAAL